MSSAPLLPLRQRTAPDLAAQSAWNSVHWKGHAFCVSSHSHDSVQLMSSHSRQVLARLQRTSVSQRGLLCTEGRQTVLCSCTVCSYKAILCCTSIFSDMRDEHAHVFIQPACSVTEAFLKASDH